METQRSNWKVLLTAALGGGVLLLMAIAGKGAELDAEGRATAREFYNAGTQKLREGKLADAESYLQSAVAGQDMRVQPTALYNLGTVRFKDGTNQLANTPEPKVIQETSERATSSGGQALKNLETALAGEDVSALVEAYQRGRGARKELRDAMDVVKRAMDTYGAVLTLWRRALCDFRGAVELQPADKEARFNADVTDRYIARLVDLQQALASLRQGMADQREALRKKLSQAKGRMPDQGDQKGGDDGDEDEDGNKKPKDLGNGFEGPMKNGHQMQLTREEARRLLNMLLGERKLSAGGFKETSNPPQDRKGQDW